VNHFTSLSVSIIAALFFVGHSQAEDFTYTTNNGTVSIAQYQGPGGPVAIPNNVGGLPVTSVGGFGNNAIVTSVTIPGSVTSIGDNAFNNCTSLTNVTILDSAASIGDWSFFGCTGLVSVAMGNRVISIGMASFQSCTSLTSITIPDSVTNIADGMLSWSPLGAFAYCTGLTNLIVGSSVTNIGDFAFAYCAHLASITFGDSVLRIGTGAFEYCGFTTVTIPNSVTSIEEGYPFNWWPSGAFYSCPSLTNVIIGESITNIGYYAFSDCTNLTSITIGSGVVRIASGAFQGCTSLTGVTIPKSVTTIEVGYSEYGNYIGSAFSDCTNLTAIKVDPLNPAYSSLDGVLFNKNQTALIAFPQGKSGSYTIPASVTDVGYYAFGFCYGLSSVTIPESVTSLEEGAFANCTNLANITIPDGVATIGDSAFANCPKLVSVAIPDSVTSIGGSAFAGCGGLANLTLGKSVVSLGTNAFGYCIGLTNLTFPNTVIAIADQAFASCTNLTQIYFQGNAPSLGMGVFANYPTVYYLPGTTGWGPTFPGFPKVVWALPNPVILTYAAPTPLWNHASFGVRTNAFGFLISWATNVPVVVEASANLFDAIWSPLATNTLSSGTSYFSDPRWTNYPARFYRVRPQ
jgi:hypothetical protein